uniref:Small integral membrane protein 14 n=1 Tax=Xenopus tropicalis TaxID=8364 RepID=A0A6I8PYY8_XENTR
MAEGNFDPCECICSHEHAMRRLINLVRIMFATYLITFPSSAVPGPNSSTDGGFNIAMIAMAWLVIGVTLYLLRPRSLRGNGPSAKPNSPHSNQGPEPPAPPVD